VLHMSNSVLLLISNCHLSLIMMIFWYLFQHETGLCKNLLQEYAQKMNYAIPVYQCQKDETPGRVPLFSCTVEIGGIRYIGAAARTKKEAEIKAARTALLAIQSSASQSSEKPFGNSQLTVIPCKKRGTESVINTEEAANVPKAKKGRFKKKMLKKKLPRDKAAGNSQVENAGNLMFFMDNRSEPDQTDVPWIQEASLGTLAMEAMRNSHLLGNVIWLTELMEIVKMVSQQLQILIKAIMGLILMQEHLPRFLEI
jgi:hypothetical protein